MMMKDPEFQKYVVAFGVKRHCGNAGECASTSDLFMSFVRHVDR